jgi:AcrR family transcriptional regulator
MTARSTNVAKRPRPPRGGGRASAARREELLRIAADVFAEKGYANATVRDIAERAGMLSGSLYYHFESKDAVLREILSRALDDLHRKYLEAIESTRDERGALEALLAAGLRFVSEQHAVAKIIQNDFPYLRTVENFEFVNATSSQIQRLWTDALEKGRDAGALRSDLDVGLAYRTLMGTIMSTARWASPDRARAAHPLIVRLALQGLGARDRSAVS